MTKIYKETTEMSYLPKFELRELKTPALALKQGCSGGSSVLVRKIYTK